MEPRDPPPPFAASLCHGCAHLRVVAGKRSRFLLCEAPDLPRYPAQPVLVCAGFTPRLP